MTELTPSAQVNISEIAQMVEGIYFNYMVIKFPTENDTIKYVQCSGLRNTALCLWRSTDKIFSLVTLLIGRIFFFGSYKQAIIGG